MEIYGWWNNTHYTSAQIRKLKKKLKKSYKIADKISKKSKKIEEADKKDAESFLDESIKTI